MTPLFATAFPFREKHKTDCSNESGKSMQTVRFMPREAEYRYYYKCIERYFMGKQIETLSHAVLAQCVVLFRQGCAPTSFRGRKLLCIIGSALFKSLCTIEWPKNMLECFILLNEYNHYSTMICSSKCSDSGECIFINYWLLWNWMATNWFSAEERA